MVTPTIPNCPNYFPTFQGPTSVLAPTGGTCTASANPFPNTTNCTSALRYISPSIPASANMKLYTPGCYETGSSISHFEDMCYPTPVYGNDQYFVMSNAANPAFVKRYLKEEERLVLCDIGYSCVSQYTSNAILSSSLNTVYNYTAGNCAGPNVWGVNDGLIGNTYTWVGTNTVTVPISGLTPNDSPGSSPTCITFAYNYPGLSLNVTSTHVQILVGPTLSFCGPVLLQYLPKNGSNYGNITYFWAYFKCPGCNPPNLCDLVQNGGFENTSNNTLCSSLPFNSNAGYIKCWYRTNSTPDVFTRNCQLSAQQGYNIGSSACATLFGLNDTHNGTPNDRALGLAFSTQTAALTQGTEIMENNLSSQLVPTSTYVISFWAFNSTYISGKRDVVFTFATAPAFQSTGPGMIFPGNLNTIADFTLPAIAAGTWSYCTRQFVFNSPGNQMHAALLCGPNIAQTTVQPNPSPSGAYVIIDDVSIMPLAQAANFTMPNTICSSNSASNLAQYASAFPGYFSGPGVTQNAGVYNFNSPPTLTPGVYSIAFTYTNSTTGCTNTVWSSANVGGITTLTNNTSCSSNNYSLVATGFNQGTTFQWLPGGQTSSSITVNPGSTTIFTLIANTGSCVVSYTAQITIPLPPVINPVSPVCVNGSSQILQTLVAPPSPTTGVFSGPAIFNGNCGGVLCTFIAPSNSGTPPGTYTYSYTLYPNPGSGLFCPVTTTFNATILPDYTLTLSSSGTSTNCFNAGQTVTLTANINPAQAATYTWLPTNQNSSFIVITPTALAAYTVLTSNSACDHLITFTVNPLSPPTFTNVPPYFCSNTNYQYLENYLAPGTPTGGSFSGIPGIINGGPGFTSLFVPLGVSGTYSVSYTYTSMPGNCTSTAFFTVNIAPGFSLTTNIQDVYCANLGNGAVISATATPSSGVTFTWYPGGLIGPTHTVTPGVNTSYTVYAGNGTCSFFNKTDVIVKNDCCSATNYFTSNTLSGGSYFGSWAINQDMTINGSVLFTGEFRIAPNVTVTVANGAFLDVSNSHMYSCGDMWHGIIVNDGGKLRITKESLIEDGINAVTSLNCTAAGPMTIYDLDLSSTTFNNNYISVLIKGYNQPTNAVPFHISNCVFTSRNIPFTTSSWPPTSSTIPGSMLYSTGCFPTQLGTPFCLNYYNATTTLKAPYPYTPPIAGVMVENSGLTSNATATNPLYYSVTVGPINVSGAPNVFDNLLHGIYGKNSNVISKFNTFQNTRRIPGGGMKKSFIGGIGIYGMNDNNHSNTTHLISTVPVTGSPFTSEFYDCHLGIKTDNIFQLEARYCNFKSNISSAAAVTATTPGQFAIHCTGNQFKNYNIRTNNIYNHNVGVYLAPSPGQLIVPGTNVTIFGAYYGLIQIWENLFTPVPSGSQGNAYIGYGVMATGVMDGVAGGSSGYENGAQLRINNNQFSSVYRGIYVSNFSNSNFPTLSTTNIVSLIPDVNSANLQFGIAHLSQNRGSSVNSNTITGVSVLNNPLVSGVYMSMNLSGNSVQCNSVVSVHSGFWFEGSNTGSIWFRNKMRTNTRGLRMSNNAIISQQGSVNNPGDNEWQGSWGGTNGTWTDGSTFPTSSPLYIRNNGIYVPPNNANSNFANAQTYLVGQNTVYFSNSVPFQPCTGTGGGGCTNCNPSAMTSMNDVATDNVTYTTNISETKEINKDLLFKDVDNEPALTSSSSTLEAFYNANVNSARGIYKMIENHLRNGNFVGAGALLASRTPTSTVEQARHSFFELYKNFLANGYLTAAEKNSLQIIAYQCPFTDGPDVYRARDLYGLVTEEIITYNDVSCSGQGYSGRYTDTSGTTVDRELATKLATYENETKKKFAQFSGYEIYPNPAINHITIEGNKESEIIQLSITDVNGRILFTKQLNIRVYKADVKLEFINGIYFVNLINESGARTTKKLVITK